MPAEITQRPRWQQLQGTCSKQLSLSQMQRGSPMTSETTPEATCVTNTGNSSSGILLRQSNQSDRVGLG